LGSRLTPTPSRQTPGRAGRPRAIAALVVLLLAAAGVVLPATVASAEALTVQAVNSYSARLQWTSPSNAVTVRIFRGGRFIDSVPAQSTQSYTDYLLWQKTTYNYTVKTFDSRSALLTQTSAGVTTPAQSGSFPRLYSNTSFWNTPIAAVPALDAGSAGMVSSSLSAYYGVANVNNNNVASPSPTPIPRAGPTPSAA
jgi:hypothetical protein